MLAAGDSAPRLGLVRVERCHAGPHERALHGRVELLRERLAAGRSRFVGREMGELLPLEELVPERRCDRHVVARSATMYG